MTASRRWSGRPYALHGETHEIITPRGTAHVTVNFEADDPVEIFVRLDKNGTSGRAEAEAIGRLLSTGLQHDIPLKVLTAQLRGLSSDDAIGFGPNKILSMPDAIARMLENYSRKDGV